MNLKKSLGIGIILCLSMTAVVAQTGIKVVLKADTSKYLARCNNCIPDGAYPDSAFVHANSPQESYAQFVLEKLENGKYALKSDTGNYLARCDKCIPKGAYSDSAFVHVTSQQLSSASYAQFVLNRLQNGKYTLKADTGMYLARCNECIPGGTYPDSAFIHVPENQIQTASYAQWDIAIVP